MAVVMLISLWVALSVIAGLVVLSMCRAGHDEDDHWAATDRSVRRHGGRGPRPSV